MMLKQTSIVGKIYVILSLTPSGDSACKHHICVQQHFFSRHSVLCVCVRASAHENMVLQSLSLHCNSIGTKTIYNSGRLGNHDSFFSHLHQSPMAYVANKELSISNLVVQCY